MPNFRRLKIVEFKDVLQIVDLEENETLSQKLQELHDRRWSTEKRPLWKLVVMRGLQNVDDTSSGFKLHIAFVYHHVIGDGLSGAAFHRSLIRTLGEIDKTGYELREASKAIEIPVSAKLIEPIERLISLPLSWLFLLKQILNEYAPRWLIGAPPPLWAGLPMQTLDECPLRSRNRIVTITPDGMENLLEESRKRGVSLTSLFTASLVCNLAKALPEAPRFLGTTAYTLRRVTRSSMDEMVNQSTGLLTSYEGDLLRRVRNASTATGLVESLWDTALFFHSQLQAELAKCPRDNLVGLLPYVVDHVEFYRKKFGKGREATWEVSNLGVFKTAPDPLPEKSTLESMTFTQGAQPLGAAFSVNCVSIQGGPLTIAFTWQDSVVDEDIIDALAQGFEDLPGLLECTD